MKKQLQTTLTTNKMKQQSIITRLQTQYNKLTQLLQTKGNQFSQFKYQQILNRISRCGLQMKRLGMGMGVCLALGVGTPVMGQYPPTFVAQTGNDNPFGVITNFNLLDTRGAFVDIDGDGDLDLFRAVRITPPNYTMQYYENIGTATSPIYADSTGTNNLSIGGGSNNIIPTFVDIDNDGDYDCFATPYLYSLNNVTLAYYPNTGTSTNPFFTFGTNPLQDVVTTLGAGNAAMPNFVDIDNDGDLDCFVMTLHVTSGFAQGIWYYENTGTVSNPVFTRRLGANNPMDFITFPSFDFMHYTIYFNDIDMDGDKDAVMVDEKEYAYYENTGTASMPIFTLNTSTTPLDNLPNLSNLEDKILVDIDGDMDLDVCAKIKTTSADTIRLFENTSILSTSKIDDNTILEIQPNPTNGKLNFSESVSGYCTLYNIAGKIVWEKRLEQASNIDLTAIQNGVYFLTIENDKIRTTKKLLIQK